MKTMPSDGNDGSTAKKRKKQALGRGLSALIPELEEVVAGTNDFFQCPIDRIEPSEHQPRVTFAEPELNELSQSIQTRGVLQPLLVRKTGSGFELIAGERRLRAAKRAGLHRVPVLVREIGDAEMLEMSIIENIQREDLNPLEEADAYHQLMMRFDLTQDQVASRVGKSRPAVANLLRLRKLPAPIKDGIVDGTLSMGHARALLGADTPAVQNRAWRSIVAGRLSVRQAENLIKRLNREKNREKPPGKGSEEIYLTRVAEDLSRRFGTKVQIKRKGQKGRLEMAFYSNEDLDRLLNLMQII